MSDLVPSPEAYFRQFVPQRDQLLIDLEEEARQEEIPIVGPVVGELLHILACVVHAERILELGTATGYSSIFLAKALPVEGGRLVTIDNCQQMSERAATKC
jgi:predicted O-methyltransferase YrrM